MRRRELITLLGSAAAWPLAARAQQVERMRRIGVLMALAAEDPEGQARIKVFEQGLNELGWSVDRNLRIDYRWAAGDTNRYRSYAAELLALAPDVVVAAGSAAMGALQATRSVPVDLCRLATRSVLASLKVLRGLAATPLDFLFSNMASARNGWSYSKTSHPKSGGWQSFGIPP